MWSRSPPNEMRWEIRIVQLAFVEAKWLMEMKSSLFCRISRPLRLRICRECDWLLVPPRVIQLLVHMDRSDPSSLLILPTLCLHLANRSCWRTDKLYFSGPPVQSLIYLKWFYHSPEIIMESPTQRADLSNWQCTVLLKLEASSLFWQCVTHVLIRHY